MVMTFDFVTILLCVGVFLLVAVVGTLITLSLIYPRLGRIFLRVIAAVALALAMALATWPTVSMIRKEPHLRPIILPLPNSSIGEISEAYGWSGAMAVLGGLALGFSFMGGGKKPEGTAPPRPEPTAGDLPPPIEGVPR